MSAGDWIGAAVIVLIAIATIACLLPHGGDRSWHPWYCEPFDDDPADRVLVPVPGERGFDAVSLSTYRQRLEEAAKRHCVSPEACRWPRCACDPVVNEAFRRACEGPRAAGGL
jgi:hypothetical protein